MPNPDEHALRTRLNMSFAPTDFTSRCTRIVVLWLLAPVLPVQGAAVGVSSRWGRQRRSGTTTMPATPASFAPAAMRRMPMRR
jgi:hypothetical protein